MRLYLDTNILVYLMTGQNDEVSCDVMCQISDYTNIMLTSSVCVSELIHLMQIRKVEKGKMQAGDIMKWLDEVGIEIVPVSKLHLREYAELPIYEDHRDPSDRLIIAQAISDRITLVSSDLKFSRYEKYGLQFIHNKR